MKSNFIFAFALLSAGVGTGYAAPVTSVDWTTTTTGSLAGVSLTMSGLSSQFLGIQIRSYVTPPFAAAPLSNVEAIEYGASNDWTVAFNSAIPDLLVYVDVWRGAYNIPGPDPDTNYTFSLPFTIASGLSGATVSGNTLTLPFFGNAQPFFDGILRFAGPVTSLSVVSDGLNESGQILTFATTAAQIPEPSTIGMMLVGVAASLFLRRGRSL